MQDVKATIPANATVSQITEGARARLSVIFDGFDIMLTKGTIKRKDVSPPGDILLNYFFVGYESGKPNIQRISLHIGWETLHLEKPVVSSIETIMNSRRKKNLTLTWAGPKERGIMEVVRGGNETPRKAMAEMPVGLAGTERKIAQVQRADELKRKHPRI